MSDEKSEEGLYEKYRRLKRASPYETESTSNYRERLIAASRRTHLGEGPGAVELSSAEKDRAALAPNSPSPPSQPQQETPSQKAYRQKLISTAQSKLQGGSQEHRR